MNSEKDGQAIRQRARELKASVQDLAELAVFTTTIGIAVVLFLSPLAVLTQEAEDWKTQLLGLLGLVFWTIAIAIIGGYNAG